MPTRFHPWIKTGRSGDTLFVALVVVSYVITFGAPLPSATPLRIAAMVAAGVLYTAIGIYGSRHCERADTLPVYAAYMAIQIPLGAAIVTLSEVRGMLIVLPLIGQSVEWFPLGWLVAACALISGATLGAAALVIGRSSESVTFAAFWSLYVPVLLQYGLAAAFVVIFTQFAVRERETRTQIQRLAAKLEQANLKLREYAAQVEELATLRERNRLAREIHDGLGHYLTAIHMQIEAGRAVLDRDPAQTLDAMAKAQHLAQGGLAEVRRSVAALRASPFDHRTLHEAVEELVNACRAEGIATAYAVLGETRDHSPQSGLAFYRAAQEAMTNIRKHAQASSAEVTLDYRHPDRVCLVVCDNGVGCTDANGGFGLLGIRERVQLLGGEVRVETAPGEGFALQVEVPG